MRTAIVAADDPRNRLLTTLINAINELEAKYWRLSRTLEVDRWAPILQIWHDSAEMSYVARQP